MHKLEIKYLSPEKITKYVNNTRTHSKEQIDQIKASIAEFGMCTPIGLHNGVIVYGHARYDALCELGYTEIPIVDLSHLSEAQKKAYVIADNKLALNAGWDNEMLKLEFDELKELDFDISLIGFSDMELADLFPADENEGLTDEDSVPELAEIPVSKEGDIWILGNHRVMCGDSTDAGSVAILMDGQKADMVFTDPPYGIEEKGDRSKRGGLCQGNKLKDFVDDSIEYAVKAFNICDELNIPRQVWWGANYYCHSLPQSNNWFIWDKRVDQKQHDTQSDCEMAWVKSKWSSVRIFRHLWKGMMKDSERGQARVHPTQKPVELAIWAFDYFKDVTSVIDLFLGSGSTLIACEKTNRKCYGMELDPHYVDVIIKRWQEFTGQEAIHEDGRKFNEVANG